MNSFVSLQYHNVMPTNIRCANVSGALTSRFVDQRAFAAHLDCISEHARFMRLPDVRRLLSEKAYGETPQSLPGVHLTFDGGWRGTLDFAGPLLEGHRAEALLFVTTGLIGQPEFVTSEELRNASRSVFRIGSHSHSHRLLNRLSDGEVREELTRSKQILEDLLGEEIDTLSLPGGAGDRRVVQIARDIGYRLLFTSDMQVNSRHTSASRIGRVPIGQATSLAELRRYVTHRISPTRWRRRCLRVAKRILGTERFNRLRLRFASNSAVHNEISELVMNDSTIVTETRA